LDPVTILSIFSAVLAAVWTVWTWREEHQEARQLQRDQAAALYVNPLLLASHAMESRLHGLLNRRDLALNQLERADREGTASAAAIETLWTFAQFFAWAAVNLRYGPYTREPRVLELIVKVSRTFDDREGFGNGAFRFSTAEQASLGHAVLQRTGHSTSTHAGAAALTEFAIVTSFDFECDFRNAQSPKAGLYQSRAVRSAIAAIDRAKRVEELEGRERLAAARRYLRLLTDHLEGLEGFSGSFVYKGRGASLDGAAAHSPVSAAAPRVLHRMRGRIRLGIPELREDRDFAERLGGLLREWDEVDDVSINILAGSVAIRYSTTVPDDKFQAKILAAIATPLRNGSPRKDSEGAAPVPRRRPPGAASKQPEATRAPRRVR